MNNNYEECDDHKKAVMSEKQKVIEKLKLYKQYIESNDPKKSQEIDDQMGNNLQGENLVMKCDIILGNTITYKQIKNGKCPKDYLKRWLRVIDNKPEFEKIEKPISKKKLKTKNKYETTICLKYIEQLAHNMNEDKQKTIRDLNKSTIEIKFDKKIKEMVNYNQNLVDEYHKFFRSFDSTARGLINKTTVSGKKLSLKNCLIGKAKEKELIDPDIAYSIWQARNSLYKYYPIK